MCEPPHWPCEAPNNLQGIPRTCRTCELPVLVLREVQRWKGVSMVKKIVWRGGVKVREEQAMREMSGFLEGIASKKWRALEESGVEEPV